MSTRTYLTGMAATMVVLLMVGLSGLTALGQANSNPKQTLKGKLKQTFKGIVGRDPSPIELSFWLANGAQSNGLAIQMMDWFVAPTQSGERSGMIDRAYQEYFGRPANESEKTIVLPLVQQQRIPYSAIRSTIGIDFVITKVVDVVGDPHALTVTVVNASQVSTSAKTFVGVRFFAGADCSIAGGTPLFEKSFEVPPLAPQQSATVKVSSAKILQQANSQRGTYEVVVGGGDKGFLAETNIDNNNRCVRRLTVSTGKPIGTKPTGPIPKGQSPPANATQPKKP